MLTEVFLNDDFKMVGNKLSEFKDALTEVANCTESEKICTSELTVLSYNNTASTEDKLVFISLPAGAPWKGTEGSGLASGVLYTNKILANGNFRSLVNEMKNGIKTMLTCNRKTFFVSMIALDSLGRRSKFGGGRLLTHDLARNINLAQGLESPSSKKNATLIYREFQNVKKVFSVFSEKYAYIPQTVLIEILNILEIGPMGKMVCRDWEINHEISSIHIEFPEKADEFQQIYNLPDKYIPGLYLATSDTGHCSLTARTTWRIGGSISHGFGINEDDSSGVKGKRKHMGNIDSEQFCEKADKEIFSKYSKLPERLCDLMTKDITNPSWNLNDKKDMRKNKEAIAETIKYVFKKIQMVASIGKGLEKQLFEALCDEIDPSLSYTAYDIVTMIMGLAERVDGIAKSTENNLRSVISKAPYVNFDKQASPQLVLTA